MSWYARSLVCSTGSLSQRGQKVGGKRSGCWTQRLCLCLGEYFCCRHMEVLGQHCYLLPCPCSLYITSYWPLLTALQWMLISDPAALNACLCLLACEQESKKEKTNELCRNTEQKQNKYTAEVMHTPHRLSETMLSFITIIIYYILYVLYTHLLTLFLSLHSWKKFTSTFSKNVQHFCSVSHWKDLGQPIRFISHLNLA